MKNLQKFKKKHNEVFTGLKRIMNIETVFTRSKMVRAKYFWPSLT